MSRPHVLVADWYADDFELEREVLSARGAEWSMPGWRTTPPPHEEHVRLLLERIGTLDRVDAVLFVLAPLDARVIGALPDGCKLIQRVGIGLDTVDLPAARARGIAVDNTPDYATEEVAVQATAMILSLHRQLNATQAHLLAGHWRILPPGPIDRLSTLTLGLIGLGRTARRLAELMRPLVRRVVFHSPNPKDVPSWVERLPFGDVLRESDILSLHAPLTPATRGLIDAAALRLVEPTALLVNCARGALTDADALAAAVREQRLAGVGIDVYEPEVLPPDSPLRALGDRAVLTSHTAWYSRQSVMDARRLAIIKVTDAILLP